MSTIQSVFLKLQKEIGEKAMRVNNYKDAEKMLDETPPLPPKGMVLIESDIVIEDANCVLEMNKENRNKKVVVVACKNKNKSYWVSDYHFIGNGIVNLKSAIRAS